MKEIEIKTNGNTITFCLFGNVDSTTAPGVEKEIIDALNGGDFTTAVFDCENLKYISSAGLRVVMKIKKRINDTKLIKVQEVVYEVLDLVAIPEIMEVQKLQ